MIIQTGYFGLNGPIFITPSDGKVIILQGAVRQVYIDGAPYMKSVLLVKPPSFADTLKQSDYFPYQVSECTLGNYHENDLYPVDYDSYKEPNFGGNNFEGYRKLATDWVVKDSVKPVLPTPSVPNPNPTPTNPVVTPVYTDPVTAVNNSNNTSAQQNQQNTTKQNQKNSTLSKPLIIGLVAILVLAIVNNQD